MYDEDEFDDTYDEDVGYGDEWNDESDLVTRPCPDCGVEIYEDVEQCPACGMWITAGSSRPWEGKPTWYLALGALGILAVLVVLSGLANWL